MTLIIKNNDNIEHRIEGLNNTVYWGDKKEDMISYEIKELNDSTPEITVITIHRPVLKNNEEKIEVTIPPNGIVSIDVSIRCKNLLPIIEKQYYKIILKVNMGKVYETNEVILYNRTKNSKEKTFFKIR